MSRRSSMFPIQHHKHALGREYNVWAMMRRRASDPYSYNAKNYILRGITICDRWAYGEGGLSGFDCFIDDMGRRPSDKHTVERVDNDGPYSPDNCRWATRSEQSLNKRTTRKITISGITRTLSEWAAHTGLSSEVISSRIAAGWSLQEVISRPVPRPLASLTQEQKEAYSMLTKQQRKLLEVIRESLTSNGSAPSFDEMKDALGLKSKSGVHRLIKGFEERGFIRRLPHRARALEVFRYAEDQLDAKTLATRVAFLEAENAELRARLSEVSNSKMQVAA